MLKIINNSIYHTRGDTGVISFIQTSDGTALSGYTAILSVKKSYDDTVYVLQKTITDGKIVLNHADTKDLAYGDYYYDIQVTIPAAGDSSEQIQTIGPYRYHLLPDITTE